MSMSCRVFITMGKLGVGIALMSRGLCPCTIILVPISSPPAFFWYLIKKRFDPLSTQVKDSLNGYVNQSLQTHFGLAVFVVK